MSTNANTSRSIYANHISAAAAAAQQLVEHLSAAYRALQVDPGSDLSDLTKAYDAACKAQLIVQLADVDANGVA